MASLYNKLKSTLKSSRKVKGDDTKKEVDLFSPIKVGEIGTAKNRIALAPMTRARATNDGIVGKHQADYYSQRASGGILITEGVNISPEAIGWWCTPNIFTEEQVLAWKPVTKAVHDADGLIVAQLWHTGRASHSDYQPGNKLPVAPSAIPLKGDGAHVPGTWEVKPHETPRPLETEEIPDLINAYVTAAKHAIEDAGFDGIELHSANGYILDEFLQSKTNQRTDKYGGSVDNRVRLTDELLTALCKVLPPGKIAIRYSPNAVYNDTGSPDNLETFDKAVEVAAKHKIAFIHIVDGLAFGFHSLSEPYTLERASKIIKAVQGNKVVTRLMGNCGYTKETAEKAIKDGYADMISFGRAYMVNPDLVYRFKNNVPLATKDGYDYFYTPAAPDPSVGYTDFPAAK